MFICRECGNKSSKKFPGGKCPACDSFNVRNTSSTREAIKEKEPKTLLEIVIMFLVWSFLAYGVWDRYLSPHEPATAGITKKVEVDRKLEAAGTSVTPELDY